MLQSGRALLQRLASPAAWGAEWRQCAACVLPNSSALTAHSASGTSSECSTSGRFSSIAAAPSQAALPVRAGGSLTVSYPFPIAYMADREVIVHDLARRPVKVDLLPGAVFNVPVRIDILHRTVRFLRAKWQQGTHKAKTRGEVSGGGKKPRPQKKTGMSRQGSIRSPLWKGGGATFGPVPRSHAHKLPKNVQLLGMKCALSAKCNEGRMVVVESLGSMRGAPAQVHAAVSMLRTHIQGANGNTALLVDSGERSADGGRVLRTAAGMISGVEVMAVNELTVYHVLKYNTLIISRPALHLLSEQLTNPPHRRRLPMKKAWWAKQLQDFEAAAAELGAAEHPRALA